MPMLPALAVSVVQAWVLSIISATAPINGDILGGIFLLTNTVVTIVLTRLLSKRDDEKDSHTRSDSGGHTNPTGGDNPSSNSER